MQQSMCLAHRAQSVSVDTAQVLVEPTTTRENSYVTMTRGKHTHRAHVILDRPDEHAACTRVSTPTSPARPVSFGVLQHVGAELSTHETIAAASQLDRWATLIRSSGFAAERADAAVEFGAFGALTVEPRRAKANHHDLDTVLPRLVPLHEQRKRGLRRSDDVIRSRAGKW